MNLKDVTEITLPEGRVKSITAGGRVLWTKPLLPTAYRQVEYIQSNGSQHILTGITGQTGLSLRAKILPVEVSGDSALRVIAGSTNSAGYRCYIGYNVATGKYELGAVTYLNATADLAKITELTATWQPPGAIAQTDHGFSLTVPCSTEFDSGSQMSIFARHNNGTIQYNASLRLYYLQLHLDGTVVRNFIPCYRRADGAVGLWDTVEGKFYQNEGSGSFTKGADV